MKAIISEIVLFSYESERRRLSFKEGLNIITGDSKTGKSAIIEIVDFCLFAKRPTIPIGKVTDWTEIFCVVYKVGEKQLIVARPINNLNKCYFSVETDFDTAKFLTRSYLDSLSLKDLSKGQLAFEQHLGLSVTTTRQISEQSRQAHSKATIRDAASIMFQHQNLVANKHSLFYRFDDFYKRAKVVADYPIHLGWADGEYFLLKREQEELLKKIKKFSRKSNANKHEKELQIKALKEPVECYYKALGLVLDDENITLNKLKNIAKDLPKVPGNVHENSDIGNQVIHLEEQRENCAKELNKINNLIDKLSGGARDVYDYSKKLNEILDVTQVEKPIPKKLVCPLCNGDSQDVHFAVSEVEKSQALLRNELKKVGTFKQDNSEYLEILIKDRQNLKRKIKTTTVQIRQLEKAAGVVKNADLVAALYTLRGMITSNVNNILDDGKTDEPVVKEEKSLAVRLSEVEEKIAGYDLTVRIQEANTLLNSTMDYLKSKLDFEDELRDGHMRFDLSTFTFHYHYNNRNIMLSEMGSGANWLACHLALFLSLLRLTVREQSSLPAVLFLDQPSQVYFPKVRQTFSATNKSELLLDEEPDKVDENIKQVVNIFSVINDFLDYLVEEEKLDYKPQVIVLEHADEPSLDPYIRERWSKFGKKLI